MKSRKENRNKKKILRRLAAWTLAALCLAGTRVPVSAAVAEGSVVSLGAELTADERAAVLSHLGLTEADLETVRVITISSEEEHEYYGSYLPEEVIGNRSISSCVVSPAPEGAGIIVTVDHDNITYCTEEMYQNALATAGVKDAVINVSSPTPASGTAALLGAARAYAEQEGLLIQAENLDGAINELVATQHLAESVGDARKAAQLIAAVKAVVSEKDLRDEEDIKEVVIEIAEKMEITLTDEDLRIIVELMKKLAGISINVESLREQAGDIYEEIREQGIDLSQYGVTESDVSGFLSFLAGLWNSFMSFIRGLIG